MQRAEPDLAARFEGSRALLTRHAYRMLGERAEAEDVVQDAFLRWSRARATRVVEDDLAYLRATVTRLCIDRLRSARMRREVYVGPWLPEPIVTAPASDPEAVVTLADDVSFALLLALERLSALERAAFLLHDVMDVPFAEIATTLRRSEDAVKALASRARTHVRQARTRPSVPASEAKRLRDRFAVAIATGDLAALCALLTEDVAFVGDSGGKVPAAIAPVTGVDRVGRLLIGLGRKAPPATSTRPAVINGAPGFVVAEAGRVTATIALGFANGRIAAIYVMRNPDKLGAVRLPS